MSRLKTIIDANIKENGNQEITGKIMNYVLTEIANDINTDGYFPNMSVGFADNLVGRGESVPAEFTFRATGGKSIKDGAARIKRIKGNSVVWNQKLSKEESYGNNATLSYNGNVITATLTDAANADGYGGIAFRVDMIRDHYYHVSFQQLHSDSGINKITIGNAISGELMNNNIVNHALIVHCSYAGGNAIYINTDGDNIAGKSFSIEGITLTDITQMFEAGNEPSTIEEYNARKPIVADEYAYNEGEVIHMNTESIKSIGDNAWDEQWENGGIDNTNGNLYDITAHFRNKGYIRILPNTQYYFKKPIGIVTYLFFYDEDKNFVKWLDPFQTIGEGGVFTTYNAPYMRFVCYMPTYNHDIMITLVHSGWKQDTDAGYQPYWEDVLTFDKRIKEHFPDGMKKWDMVYNKNGKGYIVKGTGRLDNMGQYIASFTGTMDYEKDNSGRFQIHVIDGLIKKPSATNYNSNSVVCSKYSTESADDSYMRVEGIAVEKSGSVSIYDSELYSREDMDAIQEKLKDSTLYYELAEPTIIEYDEPFRLDYRVADFGTEQAISSIPSAPFSADIIYQFNAVDMIRENYNETKKLKEMLNVMSAQLAAINV